MVGTAQGELLVMSIYNLGSSTIDVMKPFDEVAIAHPELGTVSFQHGSVR